MYLLLANNVDRFSEMVAHGLRDRGLSAIMLDPTFGGCLKLSWRLDNTISVSHLTLRDGQRLSDDQIDGVLVRNVGWIDPQGWAPDDLAYIHTETQAALLGWLKGLDCPVIGRLPASNWYRPQMPIACWQPLLARCGLRATETLVTNVDDELSAFREGTWLGAVYSPFSSTDRYLVSEEADWKGVSRLAACAPVCLAQPHGQTRSVCVIGEQVIWDGGPPPQSDRVALGLVQFAAHAEFNFVEFMIAEASGLVSIVGVNPIPVVEHFSDSAQRLIAEGVLESLACARTAIA